MIGDQAKGDKARGWYIIRTQLNCVLVYYIPTVTNYNAAEGFVISVLFAEGKPSPRLYLGAKIDDDGRAIIGVKYASLLVYLQSYKYPQIASIYTPLPHPMGAPYPLHKNDSHATRLA